MIDLRRLPVEDCPDKAFLYTYMEWFRGIYNKTHVTLTHVYNFAHMFLSRGIIAFISCFLSCGYFGNLGIEVVAFTFWKFWSILCMSYFQSCDIFFIISLFYILKPIKSKPNYKILKQKVLNLILTFFIEPPWWKKIKKPLTFIIDK